LKEQVEDQLSVLASVLNLGDAFVKAGAAGKQAGDEAAAGFDQAKDSIDNANDAATNFGEDVSAAAIAADRIGESAKASAEAFGGIITLNNEQLAAQHALNEELQRSGDLRNIGLESAKNILAQIGPLIGGEAQILADHIRELEDAAKQAQETAKNMADEAAQVQDEIDQLQGNDGSIEERRHAKRLQDIKDEAEANGTVNTAAYNQLVELENKLHNLKLQNLRNEGKATSSGGGGGEGAGGSGPGGEGGAAAPRPAPAAAASVPAPQSTAPVPSAQRASGFTYAPNIVLLTGDQKAMDTLARQLKKIFDDINARSR
jgi:DNA repair exonuclease SbcCD ATPase subunit